MAPAREAVALEERHARPVVGEDEAHERREAQRGRPLERAREQPAADAATLRGAAHVHADLRRRPVRRPAVEVLEGQPADDRAVALGDPQRPARRRVLAKPGGAAVHGHRLGVGGGAAAGNGLVVDGDDAREVGLARVADRDCVGHRPDHPTTCVRARDP